MTKDQALRAVELLGGINATARLIMNAQGHPINRPNLSKAINNVHGVPEWLAEQLYQRVAEHNRVAEDWLMECV